MNLFAGKRTIPPEQAECIKTWIREALQLNDETTVMVAELECREPGCPPIETVIAVLKEPGNNQQYKIHKTTNDISLSDIQKLVVKGEGHRDQH